MPTGAVQSHHRRRRSSRDRKKRYRILQFVLLIWSLCTLVAFLHLLDKIETAPIWQITVLGIFTLVGLVFCINLFVTKK